LSSEAESTLEMENRTCRKLCGVVIAFAAQLCFFCSDSLLPYDLMPESPIVVVTFDDADKSIYSTAFRLMMDADSSWTATHYFPISYMSEKEKISLEQVKIMEQSGWESGGHGYLHDNLTAIHPDSAEWRIKATYDYLVKNGLSHESFAYAYGMYNDTVKSMVGRYYKNIRTSHDYYYLDGVDRSELGYFAVRDGLPANGIIARIEEAKRLGAPLVIIGFHVILPDTAPPCHDYWCRESAFTGFVSYCKAGNYRVMSVRDAMSFLCGPP
jgi:hypothetical protein